MMRRAAPPPRARLVASPSSINTIKCIYTARPHSSLVAMSAGPHGHGPWAAEPHGNGPWANPADSKPLGKCPWTNSDSSINWILDRSAAT